MALQSLCTARKGRVVWNRQVMNVNIICDHPGAGVAWRHLGRSERIDNRSRRIALIHLSPLRYRKTGKIIRRLQRLSYGTLKKCTVSGIIDTPGSKMFGSDHADHTNHWFPLFRRALMESNGIYFNSRTFHVSSEREQGCRLVACVVVGMLSDYLI